MVKEWRIFCASLIFYTRIPVKLEAEQHQLDTYFQHSIRYFPLAGILVSTVAAAAFIVVEQFLSPELALITAFLLHALFTGALHEDGFADSCDGFGGGWDKEQILRIMKDSRVGTYGVLGLIFLFATKFFLLKELPISLIPVSLIGAAALSRAVTALAAFSLPYATAEGAKSSTVTKFTTTDLIIALLLGVLPLLLFWRIEIILAPVLPLLLAFWFRSYLKKKLGGYTGDCLGALQQLSELGFYLAILMLWKYT